MGIRIKVGLLILLAAAMGTLVILHVRGVNGPWYWTWAWRHIPAAMYLFFALPAIPFFAAQWLDRPTRRFVSLPLIMLACFAMKLVAIYVLTNPRSFDMIPDVIENRFATSYYTDAAALSNYPLRQWLPAYPELMQDLNLHSKTKPAGPILYWLMLIDLGGVSHRTATIGGLLLGVLATLSIPATYWLLKILLNDSDAAFCGASFMSLCPGFVLFFPMFDPVYILLSAALIGCWFLSLRDDRWLWSILLGAALAATCIMTFSVLVIGAFMIGLAIVAAKKMTIVLKHTAIALLTAVLLLAILWIALGYDPIATFRSAVHNQQALVAQYAGDRRWPSTIPFDLLDFLLGSAWVSLLLVIFYFFKPAHRFMAITAIAQLLIVALLGLLPAETARVWNFMLPLLMLPVGIELSRWPKWATLSCYVCVIFLTAAICQNMKFL